jgi:hypothetical protein
VAITEMQAHSPRAAGFNTTNAYFTGYTSVKVTAPLCLAFCAAARITQRSRGHLRDLAIGPFELHHV